MVFALGASFSASTLTGCGGHHSSSGNSATTLTATIDWPARSREITNVSAAAQAAIITVTPGDPNTGDPIDFPPILRLQPTGTGIAAFQQTWTSPSQVGRGNVKVQIRFYSTLPMGTTGTAANSSIATNYTNLASAGDAYFPLTVGDTTTDLGTIAVTGTIATLTVPTTTVDFGGSTTLNATALDATGKITIALPVGSVFFTGPTDFPFTIDQGGNVFATGLGPGDGWGIDNGRGERERNAHHDDDRHGGRRHGSVEDAGRWALGPRCGRRFRFHRREWQRGRVDLYGPLHHRCRKQRR